MASREKLKAVSDGGGREVKKRRKVGFSAEVAPVSCNANDSLKLHIVFTGQELQDDDGAEGNTFDPEFSERIFGEDGKIYGYTGLKIDLWLHAATFHAYVNIRYDSKSAGGKKPFTDVLAKLKEVFGDGLTEDRDLFLQSLTKYSLDFQQMLKEHGEIVSSWISESSPASGVDGQNPGVDEQNTDAVGDCVMVEELKFPAVDEQNTDAGGNSVMPEELKSPVVDEQGTDVGGNIEMSEELNPPVVVDEQNTDAGGKSVTPEELKQIVRFELTDPAVRAWHARLTPLALLFIEGAQPIQSDEPLWEVYLALEGEGPLMKVVGFCNVYRFYHYPDSTRLRISQILVLPTYQGNGFGLHLLKVVNTSASERSCYDVTMEEPSVALQKLRDTMDVLRLLSLPSLNGAIENSLSRLQSKKELDLSGNRADVLGDQSGALVGFNGDKADVPLQNARQGLKEKSLLAPPAHLVEEVRKTFQISKTQCRRCWEQLLFIYLDPEDRDLQDVFREALVQRLNLEIFEKESGKKGAGKRVVDTDNEFDNSKTFVMMRSRKIESAAGNGSSVGPREGSDDVDDEVSALTPGPEEKGKVLMEELKEREDELLGVAQAVARHCRALGLTIPLLKIWEQEPTGGELDAAEIE